MTNLTFDALKLEKQVCFPLYACARETIKLYKPFLDELDLGRQPAHLHHAALAAHSGVQQYQLQNDSEQDQRSAVAVGELIKQVHDPAEGDLDQIPNTGNLCENHSKYSLS